MNRPERAGFDGNSGTLGCQMETTLERTEKHTVRLSVEISPEEFRKDLDRAYRKVAGEVRIPGFRKGKAPRQVVDAMVGREAVLEEFVHDSVPSYYYRAIREHELIPIAEPEIDLDQVEDAKPLRFTAVVEVQPTVELQPDAYRGISVDAPSAEPTEQEVDGYVDRLRDRFAELEVVSHPARTGDYVLADVRGHVHDREVPEATRVGFLTEVGSGGLMPELDKELEGTRKGDILKFNATLPDDAERFGEAAGTEVAFQVLVKEVKSKRLPAADDEFAKTASEYDTLAELREDIRVKLHALKEQESNAAVRDLILRRLVDTVDVDLPERLVDRETDRHVRNLAQRAERAGLTLEQALDGQGWDELRFRSDARAHAVRDLRAELILEAVGRAEGIRVEPEDLDREIEALARATGRTAKDVRKILERSGEVASLAGDIIRSKALDVLVEHAEVRSTPPHRQGETGDE